MDNPNQEIEEYSYNITRSDRLQELHGISKLTPLSLLSFPLGKRLRCKIEAAQQVGLRELPYPFEAAIAVDSDIDRSNRRHYSGYVGQLVDDLGLDFGDSVWLHSNRGLYPGIGFFSRHLTLTDEPAAEKQHAETSLDWCKVLAEYHRGNIDHWHSFLVRGPRVTIVKQFDERDGVVYGRPPREKPEQNSPLFNSHIFPVTGVSVFTCSTDTTVARLWIETEDGGRYEYEPETDEETYPFLRRDFGGEGHAFFVLRYGVESCIQPPDLEEITGIGVELEANESNNEVVRLYLYNFHTGLLLNRLSYLRDECHVAMNLITTHAQWHFYHSKNYESIIASNRERISSNSSNVKESYFGSFDEPGLQFSTVADEKDSFCRLFPDLVQNYGLRFVRLSGGDLDVRDFYGVSNSPFNAVYPTRTRTDSCFYIMRNTASSIPEHLSRDLQPEVRRKTTALTFAYRLATLLVDATKYPGSIFVFYTHLGNLWPHDKPTEPYFEEPTLLELRRRMYGLPKKQAEDNSNNNYLNYYLQFFPDLEETRIWFSRPSVVCDFALMMQALPGAVEREGENVVRLHSWDDPILGVRLPESVYQLYGITFYVADAAAAQVLLDGMAVTDLVRNRADDSGRESVTVAACGIRHVVFDEADPKLLRSWGRYGGQWKERGARWAWMDKEAYSGSYYGRLTREPARWPQRLWTGGDELGHVKFSCKDMPAPGCQHFMYALRRGNESSLFGIVLETVSGEYFYFGDEALLEDVQASHGLAGWYVFDSRYGQAGKWRRYVVPFYDMCWSADVDAHCGLPSRGIRHIEMLLGGGEQAQVDIDCMELGRPRTSAVAEAGGRIVIGGRARGRCVRLGRWGGNLCAEREAEVDAAGSFRFVDLEPGAYALWTEDTPPRKPLVIEANSDRFDIVIN